MPEIKFLLDDSALWKGERSIAEIVPISRGNTVGALSYDKATESFGTAMKITVVTF